MVARRRCGVCGSKQWHKSSSGLICCSEGHILQNYRNETTEADDVGNHMMNKRTLKSNKKKTQRQSKANPKLYHGSRGRFLYFQCQQLILRKQIAALTRLWSLPQEFELVCRDLWSLHLSLLPDPPPSEASSPALNSTGEEDDDRSRSLDQSPNSSPPPSSSEEDEPDTQTASDIEGGGDNDVGISGVDEEDAELAQLMKENSESEDDDDEKIELDDQGNQTRKGKVYGLKHRRGHYAQEGPANNLAVLIVALWMLRIPIMYRDLTRLVGSYELPYLDPIRLLPKAMVSHLTKHDIQALSPAHAPKTLTLHSLTSHLAKQLYHSYMVVTPEANTAPILWRIVQGMGGNPALYAMTKRLSYRLSLPLVLHQTLAPKLLQKNARDPQAHKYDNAPVEASLLAAVIVVLKMVYGLDGERRSPKDSNDPAFALPNVKDYLDRVATADPSREAVFNSEKAISMDKVNDEIFDEYLAFCERALLRPVNNVNNVLEEEEQMLSNYFGQPQCSSNYSRTWIGEESHSFQKPATFVAPSTTDGRRPGEKYTIFHSRDMFGSVPEEYELVVKRGSELIGVSEEYIDGLVEKFERRKLWMKT